MQSRLGTLNDNNNFGELDIANSKKLGSFLEWIIKRIFQSLGFYASNSCIIDGNQIDVFINIADIKIICECKQHEKSKGDVRGWIHEWNSKTVQMKCNKTLLVLWGYPKINGKDYEIAKKYFHAFIMAF